jgi:uncharacterized protein (TIGR00288 family)
MMDNESIGIYIDGDNASYKDAEIMLNEIKNYGRIIISRVYGDWSQDNMKNWLKTASTYGIIPIQCERISGKNSSDIKLCVDIMKDLYTLDNITLFYIITTDSDYRHVISEIKLRNKRVNCIGNNNANISLKSICDTYTKIDVLRGNDDRKKKKLIDKAVKNLNKDIISQFSGEIEELLIDKDRINLSLVKDVLTRKLNFDLREWGYNKMSKFFLDNFSDQFSFEGDKRGMYISSKD